MTIYITGIGSFAFTARIIMADIFVSYRRDDSQWSAGRINDRLEAVFGADRVFFDTVTIRPGEDFHQVLGDRTCPLSSAEIVRNMGCSKELGHDTAHPGRSLA